MSNGWGRCELEEEGRREVGLCGMNGEKSEKVRGRSGREGMANRQIDPQPRWHWGNEEEGRGMGRG
jgi:hypothetical protein